MCTPSHTVPPWEHHPDGRESCALGEAALNSVVYEISIRFANKPGERIADIAQHFRAFVDQYDRGHSPGSSADFSSIQTRLLLSSAGYYRAATLDTHRNSRVSSTGSRWTVCRFRSCEIYASQGNDLDLAVASDVSLPRDSFFRRRLPLGMGPFLRIWM